MHTVKYQMYKSQQTRLCVAKNNLSSLTPIYQKHRQVLNVIFGAENIAQWYNTCLPWAKPWSQSLALQNSNSDNFTLSTCQFFVDWGCLLLLFRTQIYGGSTSGKLLVIPVGWH